MNDASVTRRSRTVPGWLIAVSSIGRVPRSHRRMLPAGTGAFSAISKLALEPSPPPEALRFVTLGSLRLMPYPDHRFRERYPWASPKTHRGGRRRRRQNTFTVSYEAWIVADPFRGGLRLTARSASLRRPLRATTYFRPPSPEPHAKVGRPS